MKAMKRMKKLILMTLAICFCFFMIQEKTVLAQEDMKIIYVQVPEDWENPCLWAWSEDGTNAFEAWPGQEMTLDENNEGWYYCYVPAFVSNVIVNACEGTVQTADLATESQNAWITVLSADKAELTPEQLTKGDLPEYVEPAAAVETEAELPETVEGEMLTVYAKVPEGWGMPCLWAWSAPDGTNVFANWPGQELELLDSGWYTYEIPDWVNSIIINGNLGEVQTADISIESKDVWVTVTDAETYEVVYEEPTQGADGKTEEAADEDANEEAEVEPVEEPIQGEGTNWVLIIVITAILLAAAIVFIIIRSKKKN